MNGVEEAPEEGEVTDKAPASDKVHVRGLDNLNTYDIEGWVEVHHSNDLFKRVEWIDDTSANLIYDTELAAAEALNTLSAEQVADPLQLRAAKRLTSHPDQELYIRQAILADVKAPRAKDRSKFYLFNQEWDPDNPDNIRPDNRKRRWQDDDRRDRKYRRRDYGSRRSSPERNQFHESMYDDDPKPVVAARKPSYSSESEHGRRRGRYNDDLVRNTANGRLRDRSASPGRDGDGRYGFADVHPPRNTARPRSPRPSGIRPGRDNSRARDDLRKELFPDKRAATTLSNDRTNGNSADLFANRPVPSKPARELFPERLNGTSHRRQSAKDITANEVADAIGKYSFYDGTGEAFTYSRAGRRSEDTTQGKGDLFSRISGGPKGESSYGRLRDPAQETENGGDGFSFKGAGRSSDNSGFSILGASRERVQNPLVKELFPLKASGTNGAGKDLFDGRIKGHARRRAEDLI